MCDVCFLSLQTQVNGHIQFKITHAQLWQNIKSCYSQATCLTSLKIYVDCGVTRFAFQYKFTTNYSLQNDRRVEPTSLGQSQQKLNIAISRRWYVVLCWCIRVHYHIVYEFNFFLHLSVVYCCGNV